MIDVDIMGVAVASAVAVKLAVLDHDIAAGVVSRQDTILIVFKQAVTNDQSNALLSDSRPVQIHHRAVGKSDMFDLRIVSRDHPNGFSSICGTLGIQMGHAAYADQTQVVGPPDRDIAFVNSRINQNGIAIRDEGGNLAGCGIGPAGTYQPCF